jgi:hypothetical protein
MDDVLYLVHAKYDGKLVDLQPSPIENANDQFPGIYFSLITKQNRHREPLYYDNNILIYSKKLLEQQNYHININDYNGFINEQNTYFSWQLDKAVEKINHLVSLNKSHVGNEVVFHDTIPLSYLCLYIQNINIANELTPNIPYHKSSGLFLPSHEIYNDTPPDMSKIPFYCVPYENNYSGIDKFKLSSKKFYVRMAKMCNIKVSKSNSREEIIKKIKNKMNYLYNNRQLLRMENF